jgi:DNA modification methylase
MGDNKEIFELNKIYCEDCLSMMVRMPDNSVDCVVTSPLYWGLRNYGVEGQLGLEKAPGEYVAKMVQVFREVRRVLKPEGTLWLNLGDSYMSGNRATWRSGASQNKGRDIQNDMLRPAQPEGLKPKDLIGVPWRVAFALQADGWYLRQDIIWAKPNPMPESVTDRCTKSHEYIFLLTKSANYYFDAEAIKEKAVGGYNGSKFDTGKTYQLQRSSHTPRIHGNIPGRDDGGAACNNPGQNFRNRRSVWTVSTKPYSGAHFATFPPDLIEPMILAGTSERGVCSECGKPWARETEKQETPTRKVVTAGPVGRHGFFGENRRDIPCEIKTLGWRPSCACAKEPVPAIVYDPFMGAGTTAMVAKKLQRHYIGSELNPEYVAMAEKRIGEWLW